MNTRFLIIIGIIMIVSIGSFVIFFQTQLTDIAPCFDKEQNRHVPCTPEKSIQFYEYKGEEWMKAKKKEMIETMQNNTFHEWIDLTKDDYSHWNVYQYYSYSEDLTKYIHDLEGLDSRWITDELENENVGSGSYELENPLCMGGRGILVSENCERIGKYDPATGIPIVENKEQCDMLKGDWNDEQKICESKYGKNEN